MVEEHRDNVETQQNIVGHMGRVPIQVLNAQKHEMDIKWMLRWQTKRVAVQDTVISLDMVG